MGIETLTERAWQQRRSEHEERVDAWVRPFLARRDRGLAHPVEDFLFTYYSCSPAALRRWRPGIGVHLDGPAAAEFSEAQGYVVTRRGVSVDTSIPPRRVEQIQSIRRLLHATATRPEVLSCFGLHEWAMVYRQPAASLRHPAYPLRLGAEGTDLVVEGHRLACTHYDAFRFFTADAAPLNPVALTRQTQLEHDQPGCLHATMDCYKWAYRLGPFTSAELVADCFALAREVRRTDMRAAPYDLSSLGIEPLQIETPTGKSEYVAAQRDFAERARPLRQRLLAVCDSVLAGCVTGAVAGAAASTGER